MSDEPYRVPESHGNDDPDVVPLFRHIIGIVAGAIGILLGAVLFGVVTIGIINAVPLQLPEPSGLVLGLLIVISAMSAGAFAGGYLCSKVVSSSDIQTPDPARPEK